MSEYGVTIMDFNNQTNEELEALKEAIEDELWRRDKIGKHEVYWIRYPYLAEAKGVDFPTRYYLTAEEAHAEAIEYMDTTYGTGNYEIDSFGRCIRTHEFRMAQSKWSNVMDTTLNSKWVPDE